MIEKYACYATRQPVSPVSTSPVAALLVLLQAQINISIILCAYMSVQMDMKAMVLLSYAIRALWACTLMKMYATLTVLYISMLMMTFERVYFQEDTL